MKQKTDLITTLAVIVALLFSSIEVDAQNSSSEIEKRIDQIIAKMTLEEKVAMCHAQSKFSSPGVPRLGIPELWMSDGPHGVRAEINWDDWGYAGWTNDSCTAFPALTALAASFNPALSFEYGKAIGAEARYRKKDVLLGPGVNIYRTPLNGRNFEYLGEDPFLASKMVVPYIKGVQQNGVAACVKHYALNNQEEWRGHINVELSDRALREIYLPAFKAAVLEGGTWSIMGAYNKVRGQHCCHNELLLNKILKNEWGFDGAVITDWGAVHDAKEAIFNGLDIEMGTWTNGLTASEKFAYDEYFLARPFLDLLKKGEIPVSVLDDKVRRILRLMMRTTMSENRPHGAMFTAQHSATAFNVAKEGIVLLKNNNILPIAADKNIKIAIVGENATRSMALGGGSSELKARYEISVLEAMKAKYKNASITYAKGYSSGPAAYGREIEPTEDQNLLQGEAVKAAAEADLVLFVGGLNKNHFQDCEGGDRKNMALPFGQNELLNKITAANPNVAVILISGNAVDMPWLNKVEALVQAWYLGSEAGNAIVSVLCGETNPSGKLPFSFPVKLADNAAHHFGTISYPGDSINQHYMEDILVGYRWHETKKIKPLFAFGYGLSYTSFQITNIATDKDKYADNETIRVSADIANTGNADGAEVLQVYTGMPKSKVDRSVKELKGFVKQEIKTGTKSSVTIEIPVKELAYFDQNLQKWVVEKGQYNIMVGNASNNIAKTLKITIL
jgi:beta-glucosidase